MSDTWWIEPTPTAHQSDPPQVELFAGEEIRVDRWAVSITSPTFTVTLQGAL